MELQSDWDNLFDFSDFSDDGPSSIFPNHESPLSVADIEQLLFKDDDEGDALNCDGFLHDILLDSPIDLEKSGEVVDSASVEEKDNSDHDPLDKKRKRQLRNRDAAVRSRERKKLHLKDLEMKSRYFEGECKRLSSLLQWYMAENQALRFSLHSNSTNSSMTKQESAVLLLESLLLGSLLWLMGVMVVLPSLVLLLSQHQESQSQLVIAVEEKHLPLLAQKKVGSETVLVGKRFKASRSRMRRFHQVVNNILLPVS